MAEKKYPEWEMFFTTQTVKEIEDKSKKGFYGLLAVQNPEDFKVSDIVLFVEKGCRVEEAQASKMVDEYFASGGDFFTLIEWVMEKLQKSGFLGRPQDLEKAKEEAVATSSLQTTGKV